MAVLRRLRDLGYAAFFAVHLFSALGIDLQLFVPKENFPPVLVGLHAQYVKDYKDPILGNTPAWALALLVVQFVLQVPFLVVGIFGSLFGARWMRTPAIIYGTSVVTMAVPMLAHILYDNFEGAKIGPVNQTQRNNLATIYGGFAFMGLMILLDYVLLRGGAPSRERDHTRDQITIKTSTNQQKKKV